MTQVSTERCCEAKTKVLRIRPYISREQSARVTAGKRRGEEPRRYFADALAGGWRSGEGGGAVCPLDPSKGHGAWSAASRGLKPWGAVLYTQVDVHGGCRRTVSFWGLQSPLHSRSHHLPSLGTSGMPRNSFSYAAASTILVLPSAGPQRTEGRRDRGLRRKQPGSCSEELLRVSRKSHIPATLLQHS